MSKMTLVQIGRCLEGCGCCSPENVTELIHALRAADDVMRAAEDIHRRGLAAVGTYELHVSFAAWLDACKEIEQ